MLQKVIATYVPQGVCLNTSFKHTPKMEFIASHILTFARTMTGADPGFVKRGGAHA